MTLTPKAALAQSYSFSSVQVEGNARVDAATIVSYAGIARGETVSAARLNDAYRSIVESGLFESVELQPRGGTLVIKVVEYPTINVIAFEGNRRIKDDDLAGIVQSQSRRVYSPSVAEADAASITAAYEQSGRLAATVTPKIIRRSDNRVDLVFEIVEGKVVEIERISFVGNRNFSDSRLRRALGTKQAGLLRALISRDTFVADRIEFDKQVLRDFYMSRGFVDFEVLSVTPELTRSRDAYLVTFTIREGQRFSFGKITTVSDLPEIDPAEYQDAVRIRTGSVYTPTTIEGAVTRLERLALRQGLNFIRVEPRITRNDRTLELDVEFAVVRGERLFVERIDIEGNSTTLDRVIRRQFRTVEGDPFNPREIRQAADRIRALGFFSSTDVSAREGTAPDQMIVDVDVEEQPTGSVSVGLSYSAASGAGATLGFSESNFLGRGQLLSASISTGVDDVSSQLVFAEPAFLGRDLTFAFAAYYTETDDQDSESYDTRNISVSPSFEFPLSESTRLQLRYTVGESTIDNYTGTSNLIRTETNTTDPGPPVVVYGNGSGKSSLSYSKLGYTFSFDTEDRALNPNNRYMLSLSQDYAGLGGDMEFIETAFKAIAQTAVMNEDLRLRAEFEAGALAMLGGQDSRVAERYFLNGKIRGFEGNGLGPRDLATGDALGGNTYAVLRLDTRFPLGLPEEYGIEGGFFADFGSVWDLDNPLGNDDGFYLRAVLGFAIYWDTPLGPLRFNFTDAVQRESYDKEQTFDLTLSTEF
nr:outer membrane protein assembly factor BamA [Rhodovulum adriaticum]